MTDQERRIAEMSSRFADPAVYKDPAGVVRLQEEFDALKRELGEAEDAWHMRAEAGK